MGHVADLYRLPAKYPTHKHESAFWESLGRAVATFGFLEEILGRAIFALTATRRVDPSQVEEAYKAWLRTLERSLTDPLGNLISAYEKALRENQDADVDRFASLLDALRTASEMRNVFCHGSWRLPDANGASVPFFVNRKNEIFETAIDRQFLDRVQRHVAELSALVVSSVTELGWQFPGSAGPGKAIRES